MFACQSWLTRNKPQDFSRTTRLFKLPMQPRAHLFLNREGRAWKQNLPRTNSLTAWCTTLRCWFAWLKMMFKFSNGCLKNATSRTISTRCVEPYVDATPLADAGKTSWSMARSKGCHGSFWSVGVAERRQIGPTFDASYTDHNGYGYYTSSRGQYK